MQEVEDKISESLALIAKNSSSTNKKSNMKMSKKQLEETISVTKNSSDSTPKKKKAKK